MTDKTDPLGLVILVAVLSNLDVEHLGRLHAVSIIVTLNGDSDRTSFIWGGGVM